MLNLFSYSNLIIAILLFGNFTFQPLFNYDTDYEYLESNEVHQKFYLNPSLIENNDVNWSITVCDDDYDGITTFTFDDILLQLNDEFQETQNQEDLVYIANSYNGLIKIENVSTNPNRVFVCNSS